MCTTEGAEICEDTRHSRPLNRNRDVEPLANDAGIIGWLFGNDYCSLGTFDE